MLLKALLPRIYEFSIAIGIFKGKFQLCSTIFYHLYVKIVKFNSPAYSYTIATIGSFYYK
ncbi:MAG: hypothetical protein MUE44_13965 [Oscillatoriaceae cyanobacterium Prado104]|nr:hypothetical protein [Oscillatoriaceae cyanobacterium Prado104]